MQPTRRRFLQTSATAATSAGLWGLLSKRALAQTATPIKRVVFWWVPEGCAQQALWPGTGPGPLVINPNAKIDGQHVDSRGDTINNYRSAAMGTYCLQPLKSIESDLTLVSGFTNAGSGATDPHQKVIDSALSGSTQAGLSLDQQIGNFLKGPAPFHAINITLFGAHAHSAPNYLSPVRLQSGGAGSPSWNPMTTYNQVFPMGIVNPGGTPPPVDHTLQSRLKLLGSVKQRIAAVHCQGGDIARAKMEAYLTSVEQIEAQTKGLIGTAPPAPPASVDLTISIPAGWTNTNNTNKYWQKSDNFAALVKIQIDTVVSALALDRTRVAFMQWSASGNDLGVKSGVYDGLHYRKAVSGLEGTGPKPDHDFGHWNNEPEIDTRDQARVFRWYYQQLAYMVGRLKAIPDGTGTLYDNTLIFCCTEYGSYNHHTNDLPYLLVGNPGKKFKKGVYLDARSGGFRNHADLLLAIAQGIGMPITKFADSTSPYTAILA